MFRSSRTVVTGLSLVLIALLVGLLGPGAHAQPVTISYAGWGSPAQIESIEAEIAAFYEKYPELNITIESQFAPWDGYHERLAIQAAGRALPDIMLISSFYFRDLANLNVFMDLRPYFERDSLVYEYLPEGSLDFLTVGQDLAALPATGFGVGGSGVTINQDMFDAAGLPSVSWDWTYDDVLSYARQLTRDTNGDGIPEQWGVNFGKSTWDQVLSAVLGAFGVSFYNEDYSASAINSREAEAAFTFLNDLVDQWNVSGGDEFLDGNIGMAFANSQQMSDRLQLATFNVDGVPAPIGPAGFRGLPSIATRPHVFAVSAFTQHPEAAWQFVRFLATEPEAALVRQGNAVARPSYLPVWLEKIEQLSDLERKLAQISQAPEPGVRVIPPLGDKVIPSNGVVFGIITSWAERFYAGEIPITEALLNMEREINQEIRALQSQN